MALYGAETWTLRAADQKYMESFEMWCWRRMEKISWTDHVRNCLLKQVIEGKIKGGDGSGKKLGRRRKKLLDGLKDRKRYSHLK
jgi:hypothetical protein